MVDITKFFIINQEQFESIIHYLNLDLNISDKNYFSSYIQANFFAYCIIFMSIYVISKIIHKLFENKRRDIF